MYENEYGLTSLELQDAAGVMGEIQLRGGKLTDERGRPMHYRVLAGRRFLVCERGLVWRYAAAGSPSVPGLRGGSVRRNSAVEMWTGKWRRRIGADGAALYDKCLVWVPLDDNVNGRQDVGKIAWYMAEKGFRHPLEGDGQPGAAERAALDDRCAAAAEAVNDRLQAEGLSGGPEAPRAAVAAGAGESDRSPAPDDDAPDAAGSAPRARCGTIAAIRMSNGRFAPTKKGAARGR